MKATLPHERAGILDILRGFAIFGIYLNNVLAFAGLHTSEEVLKKFPTASIDLPLMGLQTVFIEGKFYSLFSLLFGIGFSIILMKNEVKGSNGLYIFYRRLFILMLIGLAHILLLWDGDILLFYALVGMLLPMFRKLSDKNLLRLSMGLILAPILADIVRLIFVPEFVPFLKELGISTDKKNGLTDPAMLANYLYKEGSGWKELRNWLEGGFYFRFNYLIETNRPLKVLGMFLLGYYAGRKMIYIKISENIGLLKNLRKLGFMIGLPFSVGMLYFDLDGKRIPSDWIGLADTICYALGVVPLCLAYTASILLSWNKNRENSWLNLLSPVGRMALTNYLAQTVISMTIYYNLGMGMGAKFGYTYVLMISFGILFFQVLYSHLWFRIANYGPMEWIWRQLTYGKKIPLFKEKLTAASVS
jgi:uncharacterized protein